MDDGRAARGWVTGEVREVSMSITSDTFLWTIRVLLVVAVVWAVWRWPKAARPGVLAIVRRLLTLAVVGMLAVLNVLAPINAEYGWYMTVADLVPGDQPGTAAYGGGHAVEATRATLRSASEITGARTRPTLPLHLTPTNVGGYQDFTVSGRSGFSGTVTVWFPPSYTTAAAAHREYPVIEAFHGIQPAPYAYFKVIQIDQLIENAVAAHQLREAIVVIPHWAPGGQDNECVNVPGGVQMETWLTHDVPAWVYSNLRAEPGRTSWSALGYSAGGWCSTMASMLHPSVFATAIALGGYWRPDFDPSFAPFGPGSAPWRRYDLVDLAERHAPPVAVWTLCGRQDKLAYPTTSRIITRARAPLSVTATILPQGAHAVDVWQPHFPAALTWLGASSAGFAPT